MIRAGVLALLLVLPMPASTAPAPPPDLDRRAGFDQRIGAAVPLNAAVQDARGTITTLGNVARGKPLLLVLGYYRCPNLCDAVLHGLGNTVTTMPLHPGDDYAIAFVSIDPLETADDAANAARVLAREEPGAAVDRWHLLIAPSSTIHALASAIGYRYFFDPRDRQWIHPAGIVVVSADGRIAQYFLGVSYPPGLVRSALVDASSDHLGVRIEQFVMLCCGYDATTGRYTLLVTRVLQLAGLCFLALMVLGWWRLRARSAP